MSSVSDVNDTLNCNDDTSVWSTIDNAPNGTFTVVKNTKAPVFTQTKVAAVIKPDEAANKSDLTPESDLNLTVVSELSDPSHEYDCPDTQTLIRQSIARTMDCSSSPTTPSQPMSTIKKRLFDDIDDVTIRQNNNSDDASPITSDNAKHDASVELMLSKFPVMSSLDDASLSPQSNASLSSESGVGSMQSHDGWRSASDASSTSTPGAACVENLETAV